MDWDFSFVLAFPDRLLSAIGSEDCFWLERVVVATRTVGAGMREKEIIKGSPPRVQRVLRDVCLGDAKGRKLLNGMIPHICQISMRTS